MQFTAKTVAIEGVEARPIYVQCQLSRGPFSFQMVGLAGAAVREAKERILAAFYAHSLSLPPMRITINLSPADQPKSGAHYDLPIAIALLANMELLPRSEMEKTLSLGELALDGRIDPVGGVLAAALEAQTEALSLICPCENAQEAMLLPTLEIIAPPKLLDLIKHYRGRPIALRERQAAPQDAAPLRYRDISEVRGLERQKRALEIAAAGRHHLFMVGPPGAGKSLLASTMPSVMPAMTPHEILETTLIHSVAGLLTGKAAIAQRPYFDPHHTASAAAIVGGGRDAKPGEISLAHNGVLFMDELPEFKRDVLESLRQPLESAKILISRANAHYEYPAKFLLIAAANPCACGWMFDPEKWCNRAPECGQRYMERLSGPLLDRFSLRTTVEALSLEDLKGHAPTETSQTVRARVQSARDRQYERNGVGISNEDLAPSALEHELKNAPAQAQDLAWKAWERFSLSTRSFYRLLKTARTIADLDGVAYMDEDHIAEATLYRLLEQDRASFDARKMLERVER